MIEKVAAKLGLPPADQIGFVVRDLEQTIERYAPLFGPFKTMDGSVDAAEFRGQICDVKLNIAFGYSGELEFEFIQWVEGESPHSEFIQAGREGMHHIRFRLDDCDGAIHRAQSIGYQPFWYKDWGDDVKFAYLEREGDPLVIEFLQMAQAY